ncbi:EpsG family protein [Methylobacter svalbardensis]|uniref:EpsG family protein n=1 Tax=Methylobacter svalbardensis TaxID=3080016 RepID=UPI0030EC35CA
MIDLFTYFIYVPVLFLSIFLLLLKTHAYQDSAIDLITRPNRLRINHFIALLLISFIVGFRYYVGIDWEGYKDAFEFIRLNKSASFQDAHMEWGYWTINKVVAELGGSYTLMFFVVAFISWYFIFKSVPAALLPLVLYFLITDEFFFWSMNGVRQFVAASIFLCSIKFIITRNYKVYLILIIFGFLFHTSILLVAPLYFVPFQKLYNQKFWIVAFIASFIFSNTPALINGITTVFKNLFELIPVLSAYLQYFEDVERFEAREQVRGLGFYFKHLVTIFILIFSKSVIDKYPQTKVYFILYFCGAIIFNLFSTFQLIGRVNVYFLVLRSVVLAIIVIDLWRSRKYRIIPTGLVTLYFVLYLTTIYNSSNMCSPYRFDFMRF